MTPRPANRVRIIGGTQRGRIVRFPAAPGLRPTPDRVRETLFNWLGQDLSGWRCLELFAGTGVLSLEAASRGAALAVAVDRNPALVEALSRQRRVDRRRGRSRRTSATRSAALADERRQFDVILLDPPFGDDPWDWLLPACAARLAPGGLHLRRGGTLARAVRRARHAGGATRRGRCIIISSDRPRADLSAAASDRAAAIRRCSSSPAV